MSYDLRLFEPDPDLAIADQLDRLEETTGAGDGRPSIDERNRRIAEALLAFNANYELQELRFDVIAERESITEEEARKRTREVVLFDEEGLEVGLYDELAEISFPYWKSLDFEYLTSQIEEVVRLISAECPGWKIFDPQLDRFIDPTSDATEMRENFDRTRTWLVEEVATQSRQEGEAAETKAPRWKRWFGR